MKTVMQDDLRRLVAEILQRRGVPAADAEIVAHSLVYANLRGTDSHGVLRVPHYVKRLEMGSINPAPNTKFERTGPATGMVDGDDGLGQVAVWHAMSHAIQIAGESGICFVGVNNSSHCGALSFFGLQAVEAQMIGMVFSQGDKCVVPFGGRESFCGTNPICFAVPSRTGNPIMLDMATSTVAWGHIIKARGLNQELSAGWAVDAAGDPTVDPHQAKWLTPAAGPKGYALGVILDVLTGVLCGGAFGPHIVPMYGQYEENRKLCHSAGAIDYRRFPGADSFLDNVTRMVEELHQVPAADGFEKVLAPGEPEYLRQTERSEHGIPLDDYVWDELQELAV